MRLALICVFTLLVACSFATLQNRGTAQDPPATQQAATQPAAEAWSPKIQRVLPPTARPLPSIEQAGLERRLAKLEMLRAELPEDAQKFRYADIGILTKAVQYAVRNGEFFDHKKDLARAEAVLRLAEERTTLLAQDKSPWTRQKGVVIRGFQSGIDHSYQPYGLVIPESLDLESEERAPLYIWLHGRGDQSCDLQFIANFLGPKAPGPLQPKNAIVLHPFGRYCNGYKNAGETDILEAIGDVKRRYKIDPDRIVLAGFSMGGAGAWHLGAHYTQKWCAVHAGAGFVDVKRYQNITDDKLPPWYVQKLWGLYDVPDYRRNFLNVPLIAYSGEHDKQKAAADIMEETLAGEGLKMTHLIGPGMEHKYHPEVLVDIQRRLDRLVAAGRRPLDKITFQTQTMKYDELHWVKLLGMEKPWQDTRIDAERLPPKSLKITTKNVQAFWIDGGGAPGKNHNFPLDAQVVVDGKTLDLNLTAEISVLVLEKQDGKWTRIESGPAMKKYHHFGEPANEFPLRKTRELCGPIDDAFTNGFVVVRPTSTSADSLIDRWTQFESAHFLLRWRLLMRGEAVQVDAKAEPDEFTNRVLWGTPRSNPAIAEIASFLPLRWNEKTVGMGDLEFDATKVVPVMIYPDPKKPTSYVVLNSGLTFREAHDKTNSQQNPKLPDWAFIDVTQPPTNELPGKVLAAGFFDEDWKYVPQPAVDAKVDAK